MKLLKVAGILALILSLILITLQAFHPSWKSHLQVDGYFPYYDRAQYFLKHGNLTELPFNEYQPGAVFYFIALSPALWFDNTPETFLLALILSNLVLIGVYSQVLKRFNPITGLLSLSLIVAATGPILLYRFELYCHLFVFLSLYCWLKQRAFLSGLSLGVATLIKVYPILIVPYLLLLALKQKSLPAAARLIAGVGVGSLSVLIAYTGLFQVPLGEVYVNAKVHADKPVHIESVVASIVIAKNAVVNHRAPELYSNLIYGLSPKELGAPVWLYTYAWIVPVLGFYAWVWRRRNTDFNLKDIILMLGIFLLCADQLGPQYFLWIVLLIPLLPFPEKVQAQKQYLWLHFWVGLLLLLNQFVFPLHYSELITYFEQPDVWWPVWLLIMRNLVFAIFLIQVAWLNYDKTELAET